MSELGREKHAIRRRPDMNEEKNDRTLLGEVLERLGPLGMRRIELRSSIESIRRYIETVTRSFVRERELNEQELPTRLEVASDEDEAQSICDEMSKSGYLLVYEFPDFALQTTFVATYSLLEDQMADLANFMGGRLGITLSLDDLSHKGIHASKVYLERLCDIPFPEQTRSWQQVVQYNRLRNVVAHARGRIKDEDRKSRNIIESKKGLLAITTFGQLKLTREFCLEVLDDVEVLLNELFGLATERLTRPM
jgi:hypothetical protein